MFKYKLWIIGLFLCCFATTGYSHINPDLENRPANQQAVNFRADCAQATEQIDMDVNNVRARLLTGGDVWWDGDDGRYIVPKVEPGSGIPERSSIFAGAVWLGGVDPAGNLKVAAQTYGSASGSTDFWPGPLTDDTGTVEPDTCAKWDKFFKVDGAEIDEHLKNYILAQNNGEDMDPDLIPEGVKGWPALGNPFFFDIHRFELPFTAQGLAAFQDQDGDGLYDPTQGDYPRIEIRGCDAPQYPDQMIFWIYNDAGGVHTESQGDAIQMEIQVQAFGYASQDELNDMTFQRYKLINRAIESIDSMFFAMWVDADLGCFDDDFIGCDTARSLMYIYNEDALDGQTGCDCGGVNTYCDEIPILGVDYFRGPLDENGDELGMSSFTYYNNAAFCNPPPGTTDPGIASEFYNYLSGSWQDGTPFSYGGSAYNAGSNQTINYAFTETPDDQTGWSMCTAGLGCGDRRTVQASGPFKLDPGAVNELIIGVVWTPDIAHPCPDISPLLFADDLAQALFNNCFDITDGPDAPDVDFIELDRELVAVLSNDEITSNNAFEKYEESDLRAPPGTQDSLYRFEGYQIFQLAGPEVSLGELDNPEKARIVAQVDKRNGVKDLYNWTSLPNPNSNEVVWSPTKVVSAADDGLLHTFKFNEDQFALSDRRMINHKKYYYTALAYAYNNYEVFDPLTGIGQRTPYIEGRKNVNVYVPIPRPSVNEVLNAEYGDGAVITRIDGVGAGSNFLDISNEERMSMISDDFDGEITYLPGAGPITVQVYNPYEVQDGEFELTFIDEDMSNDELDEDVTWKLTNLTTGDVITSATTIYELNEQLISEYGFSVTVQQSIEPGDNPADNDNGAIGIEVEYQDPAGAAWLQYAPLGEQFVNYIRPDPNDPKDLNGTLSSMGNGEFVPYTLCAWEPPAIPGNPLQSYITPAWTDTGNSSSIVQGQNPLSTLNNVDIVFTSDQSKWSRCIVVETANTQYTDGNIGLGLETELDGDIASAHGFNRVDHMDLRGVPSVGKKDDDGDGKADPDGMIDDDGDPMMGMGWFPGYAVDVESGERLNIFFGENSTYNDQIVSADLYDDGKIITRDMIFNPSSQGFLPTGGFNLYNAYGGGQHMVYVTNEPYDEGAYMYTRMAGDESSLKKVNALKSVKWASIPFAASGVSMNSYNDGLIPNDVVIKLRVENTYKVKEGTGEFDGYPTYRFKFEGVSPTELTTETEINEALDMINVVPNPYYGYSAYETSQFTNTVKISNLPAKCTVTIYSIDGKFIRQYKRDEAGTSQGDRNNAPVMNSQISPALEWDIKNSKGIPVASGVYLIHVDADGLGERVIKWFGVGRQFDPSGL